MDNDALRDQLVLHHEACLAWARHCCGNDREEAEDVLQTVYLKVLLGRARFDGRSSLRTWLFAVIRRTAAEARHSRILRRFRLQPLDEHQHPAASEADASAVSNDMTSILARALRSLPGRQREVLLLVFYHEHTVDDAATILGISPGSARTHYARGKQRLRALLSPIFLTDGARA